MKKMILSMVALIAAAMSYAQSTLVATLSHGDEVSMFYGANALMNACDAAVSGDVINLSGGTFNGGTITKAITIRGTGIDVAFPTSITGNSKIDISESDTCSLSMEGIRFVWGNLTITGKFEKAYFLKCHFKQIFWQTTSTNRGNYKICNCKILAFSHSNNSKINFINSYVESYNCNSSNDSEALFFNCLMNGIYSPLKRASLINCILNTNSYHSLHYRTKLDSSCKAMNCLSVNNDPDFFGNLYSAAVNCSCIDDYSKVFKTYNGTDSDSETFELTDEAKTTYLGTDGTEIGLYGGDLPFNTTPSYPQITKMNVANKTTADGKLSVEIEVSAAE